MIGRLALAASALLALAAAAPMPGMTEQQAKLKASVTPARLLLGERATYRGRVVLPSGIGVHFEAPSSTGDLTWGAPRVRRGPIVDPRNPDFGMDSVVIAVPLQVFDTGIQSIPGLRFRLDRLAPHTTAVEGRLPVVRVVITPELNAADSAATLRPVRGPLAAPWWERIAWGQVLAVAVILAVLVSVVRWWRRRSRRAVPAPAAKPAARTRRDPAQVALDALAALRAEALPQQGRYGEHALALTRILREYLEATLTTEDVARLEGLLGFWDRVKFARAPMGAEEARRCEDAVEALVRRRERPQEVA
jgi:hypothetical protein